MGTIIRYVLITIVVEASKIITQDTLKYYKEAKCCNMRARKFVYLNTYYYDLRDHGVPEAGFG